jgi:hypothetical protein
VSVHELRASVSSFLDLLPDGFTIHQKSIRVVILEFTRAMDSSDDWEAKKDAEKRARYTHCFGILQIVTRETGMDPAPIQLHRRGSRLDL